MPRRIGNTIVPRNSVARVANNRRAGAHQRSCTAQRLQSRAWVRELSEDWREELAVEREVRFESEGDD